MLVKSKVRANHLKNLRETFDQLRPSKLRINPDKCSFGPEVEETLQVYLAVSDRAVSSVLVREVEDRQRPIYYVSRVLHGAEENYPIIDKFVIALVVSARKLKIYLESHLSQVVMDRPLKRVITSPQLSGRLKTWAIELSEFDISYVPRPSIKAHALADFVIKCTTQPPQFVSGLGDFELGLNNPEWVLFVDAARNEKGSGAGVLIRGPHRVVMEYALRFTFSLPTKRLSINPLSPV
ncbi:hypothetical protein LIER_38641 [Lithospermum erythrorhizon]|uniref:Reverse transcriptase RNase H-like domain-containing protein n=1 Tax=Lithospermum erythrorhizon TaxID=34254 RepID=A0AAV3Q3Y1_LITER